MHLKNYSSHKYKENIALRSYNKDLLCQELNIYSSKGASFKLKLLVNQSIKSIIN